MKWLAALALLGLASTAHAEAADPKAETSHTVAPGETLSGIANRAEVPRILIIEANALKAPYMLRAGQRLIIPRRRSHLVKAGETGFEIAMQYGVPWSAIASANSLERDAPVRAGQRLSIPTLAKPAPDPAPTPSPSASADRPLVALAWPLAGPIRRGFAPRSGRNYHDGIDITAPEGTAVRASAAGRVIYAEQGPREYGKTVIVHHGSRWTTTYALLSRITVKTGDRVKAGERIGLVGHSGVASQDQLHYEVRTSRLAIDPVSVLPERE